MTIYAYRLMTTASCETGVGLDAGDMFRRLGEDMATSHAGGLRLVRLEIGTVEADDTTAALEAVNTDKWQSRRFIEGL